MQIKIVATITAKPESSETLLAALTELVPASRAESGNVRYDLHQDIANPNRFVFVECWRDEAAVKAHEASAHFQCFLAVSAEAAEKVDIILMQDLSDNA